MIKDKNPPDKDNQKLTEKIVPIIKEANTIRSKATHHIDGISHNINVNKETIFAKPILNPGTKMTTGTKLSIICNMIPHPTIKARKIILRVLFIVSTDPLGDYPLLWSRPYHLAGKQ